MEAAILKNGIKFIRILWSLTIFSICIGLASCSSHPSKCKNEFSDLDDGNDTIEKSILFSTHDENIRMLVISDKCFNGSDEFEFSEDTRKRLVGEYKNKISDRPGGIFIRKFSLYIDVVKEKYRNRYFVISVNEINNKESVGLKI